eukprot:CAMPEP_0204109666 /NCGR_PEP_ID=MMETSP0361-20130328/1427_1 /ASSEMBLY_ACC=CAM_ASM_000343 /TAXON_ID=268821 /ORGANISM="Scrippsiella Hangoei, Strain SHTV-5" /LENGTH=547 /DNA_ID=CAMNT_0051059459 /DNA_START=60 /DNA_END=1703 /DNA_ORIENTATION=+
MASSSAEKGFTVFCMVLGLLGSSTLVSLLSSTMLDLRAMRQEKQNKLRTLRRYLSEFSVSSALACRVTNQVVQRLRSPKLLTAEMVPALDLVSSSLLAELKTAVCTPHLLTSPIFRYFAIIDESWQAGLCSQAIQMDSLSASDTIFEAGCVAEAVYIAVHGQMKYVQEPGSSPVEFTTEDMVDRDAWLCEAALWCQWIHVGTVECLSSCKVMTINLSDFVSSVTSHGNFRIVVAEYGRQFTLRVASAVPPNTSWPTDLSVPFTDFGDLLWSMPKHIAAKVSSDMLPLIGIGSFGNMSGRGAIDKISEEIAEGACVLAPDGPSSVLRVVAVVVFHVTNKDGKVLAQLGKIEDGIVSASCSWPGAKRKQGENVEGCIARILDTKFPELSNLVQVKGFTSEDRIEKNRSLQVSTNYFKLVCAMQLVSDFTAPICTFPHASFESLVKKRVSIVNKQASVRGWGERRVDMNFIDLSSREVYLFGTERRGTFCAWLEMSELRDLQSSAGSALLADQFSNIKLPAEDASPSCPSDGVFDEPGDDESTDSAVRDI